LIRICGYRILHDQHRRWQDLSRLDRPSAFRHWRRPRWRGRRQQL